MRARSYRSNRDATRGAGALCLSIPVYKDDARDEKSHSDGEEVGQRHVVRVTLGHAVQCGFIGEGDVVMSDIIPAALLQCVVSVVPVIHHSTCKIALNQEGVSVSSLSKFRNHSTACSLPLQ